MEETKRELVSREELERALRAANLMIANLRAELLALAGQVVAFGEELEDQHLMDRQRVEERVPKVTKAIQIADGKAYSFAVDYGEVGADKYDLPPLDIPCQQLLPICKARCCQLQFSLSTQDLNEGVVRWNYARPYRIRQGSDGYCVHNQTGSNTCGVYQHRPAPCRQFDCRKDSRIWTDFDKRILAPPSAMDKHDSTDVHNEREERELARCAKEQQSARVVEEWSVRQQSGDY